jgi:hypothetical protein
MSTRDHEVLLLKNRFSSPADYRIKIHKGTNGTALPCCQTASVQFQAALEAAVGLNGICGAIDFLSSKFHWGCISCSYLCECIEYADHLYCTATMGVGLEALRRYQVSDDGQVMFKLVTVELINVFGNGSIGTWKKELADTAMNFADRPVHKDWLENGAGYHNLLGIVDNAGNLSLCDFDAKFFFPREITTDEASTVCLRVAHWSGCASLEADPAPTPLTPVNWGGLSLQLNVWEDITPERVPTTLSREEQVAQLVSALGGSQMMCSSLSRADSDNSSPNSPGTVTTYESELPTPVSVARAFSGLALHGRLAPPAVLITGIHMGPNPCPGVGAARAVRVVFPEAYILAADDSKFSDPVFSDFRNVEELNNTVATAGGRKQQQWDIVAGLLRELHERSGGNAFSSAPFASHGVYYLPVRIM